MLKSCALKHTLQVNQKNVHGQTPLMLACKAGAVDCVRLLLEAGADATLFDTLQQRTCLHYAGESCEGPLRSCSSSCVLVSTVCYQTCGAIWCQASCPLPASVPRAYCVGA